MKILFISSNRLTHDEAPGNHGLELIRAFRELGHSVHPVARCGDDPELTPCRVFALPFVGTFLTELSLFLTSWRAIRREKVDLIYFRIEAQSCFVFLLRRIFRVPFFVEVNGCLTEELRMIGGPKRLHRLAVLTERMTYKVADRIIPVTRKLGNQLTRKYGVPSEKVTVVGNGVNENLFFPRPVSSEEFIVGYVGSFAPWQGLETLIDAIQIAIDRGVDLKCLIVGDGSGRKEVERRVDTPELRDRIIFKGHFPYERLPDAMERISVGVIPKKYLGSGLLPMKFFQFLGMGIPVVVSDVPEMNELVRRESLGLVFPVDDSESLAECILELARDSELRKECSERAAAYAKECTWKKRAEKILSELNRPDL